jgi:hypothetical protein
MLAEILSNFLERNTCNGLHTVWPRHNLISGLQMQAISDQVKANRRRLDQEILDEYTPVIHQTRKLFLDSGFKKNITEIVQRFYIDPKHKWKHHLFDREGSRLLGLLANRHDWYPVPVPGKQRYANFQSSLVIAIGAFGFSDFNGILSFAFSQIELNPFRLEEKRNWALADILLKDCVMQRVDLFHLVSWVVQRRIHEPDILLPLLPIADIIPGGIFLFTDSLRDDDVKFDLETHYNNLKYTEITT